MTMAAYDVCATLKTMVKRSTAVWISHNIGSRRRSGSITLNEITNAIPDRFRKNEDSDCICIETAHIHTHPNKILAKIFPRAAEIISRKRAQKENPSMIMIREIDEIR